MTEDEMLGWYHWLNGRELEQAPDVGDGQGSLACCSPWGCRVRHDLLTEKQNKPYTNSTKLSSVPQKQDHVVKEG